MKKIAILLLTTVLTAGGLKAQVVERIFGEEKLALEEIFYEDFEQDLSNWQVEGDAGVSLQYGFLDVDGPAGTEGLHAATIWCRRTFSGPQVVEYDVRMADFSFQAMFNIFLLASMPGEGPGILETGGQRTGQYTEYHQLNNYLVTILNQNRPEVKRLLCRVRMRLNPGFNLRHESWHPPLQYGRVYHVVYVVRPPEVLVFLDDVQVGGCSYETVLDQGLHGLRLWNTHSVYDNFRVSRIIE